MKINKQLGFTFDLNKCVGCQACHIACSIENELGYNLSWREINTYNPDQIQNLPHYHLSLACNHCQDPICMYQCPAQAISKSSEKGMVLIDEKKCIGCKLCSWVCPYDAPKYNQRKGLMTKCTLCNHRIEENLPPACVSICPTDALNINSQEHFEQPENLAGFPESNIEPCIAIETLKPNNQFPDQYSVPYSKEIITRYSESKTKSENKISLRNDWTLVIFTILIPVLGGWLSTSFFKDFVINPFYFILTGFLGMGLSTLHLGKKLRAYRAIFNLKNSWLSKEIFFFSLFMITAVTYFISPNNEWIVLSSLFLGYLAAVSADHVYFVIAKEDNRFWDSAQLWLTFLFFVVLFNQFIEGIVAFSFIKLSLYIFNFAKNKYFNILTFLRFACFVLGFILFNLHYLPISFALFIFSETIDRIQFYNQQHIITPQNHMQSIFQRDLETIKY